VVNRVGDFGFALGIMTVFWAFGTVKFAEIFPAVAAHANLSWDFAGQSWRLLDLACVLLFVGAMGKSAQFFLPHLAAGRHGRPDPGQRPDPRGDHGHRRRLHGLPAVADVRIRPHRKGVVTLIGAVTALFAATVGLAQNDIKRVIAYSTCSQLGYMFFAAGVGAYQGGMFHLFTHAFFKALLFLGAGSVIMGMHHEQDMRKMGGLWKYMPVTYAVMLIGTLAITGVGSPLGEIGFAGFYSKDAIINAAYMASLNNPLGGFAFMVGSSRRA